MAKNIYNILFSNPHLTITISSSDSFNATINGEDEETTISFQSSEDKYSESTSDENSLAFSQDNSAPFDELDEIALSAL